MKSNISMRERSKLKSLWKDKWLNFKLKYKSHVYLVSSCLDLYTVESVWGKIMYCVHRNFSNISEGVNDVSESITDLNQNACSIDLKQKIHNN